MKYTLEQLKKMSAKERRDALNNNKKYSAIAKYAEDAAHNIELIESSSLKLGSENELQQGDWQLREIELVVNDPANEKALIEAADADLPPLGAIEHLIVARLGDEYKGSERRDTIQAGYLVARRLDALGDEKLVGRVKKMPPGSVAKSAVTFRKKKRLP